MVVQTSPSMNDIVAHAHILTNIPTFSKRVNVLFTIKYQNFLQRAFFSADIKLMLLLLMLKQWPYGALTDQNHYHISV